MSCKNQALDCSCLWWLSPKNLFRKLVIVLHKACGLGERHDMMIAKMTSKYDNQMDPYYTFCILHYEQEVTNSILGIS